jgi:hypothetical protein
MEMTLSQIAEKYGIKSTANMRRAIKNGELKARAINERLYMVKERDYLKWVERGRPGMHAAKKPKETT